MTTRGHPRSPGVNEGQKSKIFKIGQMTYQMEGNCTGNLIQPFLAPPEVTQGHHGSPVVTECPTSKIFNIFQMTYQMEGNFTGNLMQPFLASPVVTQKFKIVKIGQNLTVKLSTVHAP